MSQPDDVFGECNAYLLIGDDYGDNEATMRCHREKGHKGLHLEVFREGTAKVEWENDERSRR